MRWLKRALLNSRATWKVIASDMPLSLIVYDDAANKKGSEAFAQGDGPARGRELEIAEILRFIKTAPIKNTVWLTADVHYAAAHYYNPDKAQFQDFEPFWEFVSGPLHAGTFGPNELDNTFGPEVRFIKAPGLDKQNLPPSAGMQFFGHVKIEGATGQMTVTLARPRRRRAVVDDARSEAGVDLQTMNSSPLDGRRRTASASLLVTLPRVCSSASSASVEHGFGSRGWPANAGGSRASAP